MLLPHRQESLLVPQLPRNDVLVLKPAKARIQRWERRNPDTGELENLLEDYESTNVITTASIDFYHLQCWGSSSLASNGLYYIACSADVVTETTASTTLSNEIVVNGFSRAAGTVTHTVGTNTTTVAHDFTCATSPQQVSKIALFSASSSGTMGHVLATSGVTYSVGNVMHVSVSITFSATGVLVPGHTLDGSTIAMWRLDATTAGDYTLNDAGPNARNFPTESGTVTQIVPGPRAYTGRVSGRTQGCLARYNRAVAAHMSNSNLGGDATALTGNWTIKLWYWVDNLSTAVILQYAASGETAATNFLLQCTTDSSGGMGMFWEQGSGVDVAANSTTGIVTGGVWQHLAWVKADDLVNVGKKKVTFYVNGVNKGTVSNLTNSTSGTSSFWTFGDLNGVNSFIGKARSIMVTSNVNVDADIAADAANTSGANAYTHTDSNVIVHYKCDELPDVWDDAGNYHMRHLTGAPPGSVAGTQEYVNPLINDGGKARHFDGSTEYQSSIHLNETMRQAVLNSWTFECWLEGGDNILSAQRGIFCFGNPGVETAVDNYAAIDVKTDGTIQYDIEHSTGTNATTSSPSAVFTATNKYDRHHFAFRKFQSAGSAVFDVFLDGVQIGATSSTLTEFDTGTNDVLRLGVGNSGAATRWVGKFDDVRISNVKRTDAEILASYQAGA